MGSTLYDGTIVVLQGLLPTLSHILHQAEQRPDASALLDARLIDDMYPLTAQVRIATQWSENLVARLSGREPVAFEGSPTTFAECQERIETVLKTINGADKSVINQHGDVVTSTKLGPGKTADLTGATYAHRLALPNIYFHVNTAYGILRKEGVPLGKGDYFAGFYPKAAQGNEAKE